MAISAHDDEVANLVESMRRDRAEAILATEKAFRAWLRVAIGWVADQIPNQTIRDLLHWLRRRIR
jgi:hypothetical protein